MAYKQILSVIANFGILSYYVDQDDLDYIFKTENDAYNWLYFRSNY